MKQKRAVESVMQLSGDAALGVGLDSSEELHVAVFREEWKQSGSAQLRLLSCFLSCTRPHGFQALHC